VSRLPVRVRLTLAYAVAMAIVLSMVGLFVYQRVSSELLATVDQTLLSQANEALLHPPVDGRLVDPDISGGTTLAQVLDAQGHVVISQPAGLAPLLNAANARRVSRGSRVLRTTGVSGRHADWRVLGVPESGGRALALARSLAARDESLDHLRHELVIFLPLALLAASLGGYALAAGALRPVEAMRRRASAVTADRPGRLPVPPSRDEVARLAVTLNDMLARLHASFEHERRFVADASHELRTPLALLRAELELALRRPRSHKELQDALRSAADETERLSRLAEDLLLLARADRSTLPIRSELVGAEEVLATVAGRFATRAASLGRELRVEPTPLMLDADPMRVEQALGNLVDNALEHGVGVVELAAAEVDDTVELHVRDDGPGFPETFRERAFDRFSRADEARSSGGAGLGLAIVELIAQAHDGSTGARNRAGGGADVWIAVPGARHQPQRSPAPSPQGDGKTPDRGVAAEGAARTREESMPTQETTPT
jgi:two-component system OmpR family sensor kinase